MLCIALIILALLALSLHMRRCTCRSPNTLQAQLTQTVTRLEHVIPPKDFVPRLRVQPPCRSPLVKTKLCIMWKKLCKMWRRDLYRVKEIGIVRGKSLYCGGELGRRSFCFGIVCRSPRVWKGAWYNVKELCIMWRSCASCASLSYSVKELCIARKSFVCCEETLCIVEELW